VKEVLDHIDELNRERESLLSQLRQLRMWDKVMAQGIKSEEVACFGFDPKLLTREQRRDFYVAGRDRRPDPITGRMEPFNTEPYTGERLPNGRYRFRIYNYVKLKSGVRVTLDPPVAPPD
jgi:hypothetical protein